MFGRKEKLHENAAKHVEADETVLESAVVTNGSQTRNTALVATDRSLYAFRLKWPGQSNIGERTMAYPIGEVRVEVMAAGVRWGGTRGSVRLVRRADGSEIETWRRYQARDYDSLVEAVEYGQSAGARDGAPGAAA